MIQGTWLPSRCLAMDGRSDSYIPAFSGMPQYLYFLLPQSKHKIDGLYILIVKLIKRLHLRPRVILTEIAQVGSKLLMLLV
jgi:hypothetical protein